jgi:hypothetical protein
MKELPHRLSSTAPVTGQRGFALVVTMTLLVLLSVVALGMLSLSAVSLRSGTQDSVLAEARANARLALMMAIGELQRQAGPDTRVTAMANILDSPDAVPADASPPLLGVWRSWEGSDHESNGRPTAPLYGDKRKPESAGGRFLGWLVSGSSSSHGPDNAKSLVFKEPEPGTVPLLAKGSLGSSGAPEVHVKPVAISSSGRMAWWISGENQKARVPTPASETDDVNESAQRIQSHSAADPEPFGLDSLLHAPQLSQKALSLESTCFLESQSGRASDQFHDLSTVSSGLLTNTATGGWRKDLSLLMASWNQQPAQDLALFRISPDGPTSQVAPATPSNPTPAQGALYPWSAYRPFQTHVFSQQAAVSSWSHLADWMNLYQTMSVADDGQLALPLSSDANVLDQANTFGCLHKQRVYPLIARIQWIFYHEATSKGPFTGKPMGSGRLRLHLKVMPVVTIWNPYNVALAVEDSIYVKVIEPIPPAIRYTFNGVPNAKYSAVMESSDPAANAATGYSYDMEFERSNRKYTRMYFQVKGPMSFGPGKSAVFSPSGSAIRGPNDIMIELRPGMRHNPLYSMKAYWDMPPGTKKSDRWTNTGLPPTTRIHTSVAFDNTLSEEEKIGTGVGIDILAGEDLTYVDDADTQLDEVRNQLRGVYSRNTAATVMPPVAEDDMMSFTLAEVHETPTPFLSMIFGLRTANNNHLASRGLVQSSPFANTSRMGLDDFIGGRHPINSSYDFSYAIHPPGGDSLLPEVSASGSGFIMTGINSADGLTRAVIAEIPSRPIASLAELSQWDLRFENPRPPYAFNLIGNSDATPLLASDKAHVDNESPSNVLQHDDAYCANHLLFDDWFVSAIAPTTKTSPGGTRTQQKVFTDFLASTRPLATAAYKPIADDSSAGTSPSEAKAVYDAHVAPVDSWQSIASRLEVEGMFNVNSTSVKAWRALLGHARNQKVPYLGAGGQPLLSASTDYAFARHSVSSDAQAGSPSFLSGAFPEASEFTGYRVFDDALLDRLAEEIVKQVRLRGPFLSLSEFVNRQLSNNDPLPLAGAIQTALNKIQQSAANPFATLVATSAPSLANPTAAEEEYQYPAAAEGFSTYGVPGWTRQADILRPLAPILSVRDDTFTIRCYGDALDATNKVVARAWCEAVVRRTRDYADSADEADTFTPPKSSANTTFGRRFRIVSFRWLSEAEI